MSKQTQEEFIEESKERYCLEDGGLNSNFDTWEDVEVLLNRHAEIIREEE